MSDPVSAPANHVTSAQRLLRPLGLRVLGGVVMLEGPALRAVAHLVALGATRITEAERRQRTRHETALVQVFATTALATTEPVSAPRHGDVADHPDPAASSAPVRWVGSGTVAGLLGVTPRTVQRRAVSLGGVRGPGRVWTFDPDAVGAAAARHRAEHDEDQLDL